MKIDTHILQPAPSKPQVIGEVPVEPSNSDKRIIQGGGCLYPNPKKLNLDLVSAQPANGTQSGVVTSEGKPASGQNQNGTGLSDSDKRIINSGGCLYPNFRLHVDPLPTKHISKVDAYTIKQSDPGLTDSDKRIING